MLLAALALPALLTPQVHAGERLHYRTTWTREMNGPLLAGMKPSVSGADYTVTVSDASPAHVSWTRQYTGMPVFVYDTALLGQPPAALNLGATWTNVIHHPGGDELWTSTVEEANAATGTVRLRLSFESHGSSGFNGDKSASDRREDGQAVFVQGIMTQLSLQGRETTTSPQLRITNAVAIETRLEGPGSP